MIYSGVYGGIRAPPLLSFLMLLLERANSFCVKHMQCYSKYTSNMYSYLTIDIGPIYLEIDYNKISF